MTSPDLDPEDFTPHPTSDSVVDYGHGSPGRLIVIRSWRGRKCTEVLIVEPNISDPGVTIEHSATDEVISLPELSEVAFVRDQLTAHLKRKGME